MRPVRIGVQLAPQRASYADIRRAAAEVEALGADILFTWDHFLPLGKVADGKHFEGWSILGAWAEQTSRIELGVLVSCNSYRNPDLLADMARTVDHISGGRVVFGIGAGFKEREFLEYGYEFPSAGRRVAELAAALPRISARLAVLNPSPVRKLPILIAGGGEQKMLRVVARHADIWNTFAEGEDFARKTALLDQYCAELGRNPLEIERSVHVGGDPRLSGPELLDAGATLFTLSTSGPDYNLDTARQWITWRDSQN
ncbi:putative F420-dependent oxidoreductase [Kribbella antiqua]|uniref:Putative F420-dependent oxidoreductase n=1 Tax=Kribbella antiqua TaxID=2512217 RepID=A0A4R2J064_9ACTN|nr:LLM class F420-dependent oxidoreductase [Kribbella antiqua]TCO50108.1 putative F420-dependent oxidoreductase [Kribbella antiqua]